MNSPVPFPQEAQGRILSSIGGLYTVETSSGICQCKARGVFRKRGLTPYTGDYVRLSEEQVITELLPRKNEILRPPVANLDQIFFVVSVCNPSPNFMLLDSFMAIASYQGIEPILVLTKHDLQSGEEIAQMYRAIGYRVFIVDYENPDSVSEIRDCLSEKISMMTGNSGVGKTTLLNAIAPDLQLETAEISNKLGRGKHTTRTVRLYECAGGYLADTPGFSTFEAEQYIKMEKDQIADCFPEFEPYLGECQFSDCAHVCEKGCGIVEAVKQGKISQARHDAYVSLYETARKRKAWEA